MNTSNPSRASRTSCLPRRLARAVSLVALAAAGAGAGFAAQAQAMPPYALWSVFNDEVVGSAQPELFDGDLAQKGWDGTNPLPEVPATLQAGQCVETGLQWVDEEQAPPQANQIVVVSRQDDWLNAVQPSEDMVFTRHGAVDIEVLYSFDAGMNYHALPAVSGNNKVMRAFDLPQDMGLTNVNVRICKTADGRSAPLTEIVLRKKA
jgi:hypothetical protein